MDRKTSLPVDDAVSVFLEDFLAGNAELLEGVGINPGLGLSDLFIKLNNLENEELKKKLISDLNACIKNGPDLAMVNSEKGITNLHVPSDVIIDASMPAAFKSGGRMWGADGKLHDMKAVIPDSSYSGIYEAVVDFCREHGAFNPATMGSVSNVGLMARKAEEYGSHDKTFMAPGNGVIRAVDSNGKVLLEQSVEEGDIFRMCQTKDNAVRDWVELAAKRAGITGTPAIFWLDNNRPHDRLLAEKAKKYLAEMNTAQKDSTQPGAAATHSSQPGTAKDHSAVPNTAELDISFAPPKEACLKTLLRSSKGQNTISVTGNVLRDYLTDLFPILELGTSARMLSIVPLLAGGGLFETGAGGSAPKHVQQLLQENHLRWDSLGEFLALGASYEHLEETGGCREAGVLARTLDKAVGRLLEEERLPSRKCGEPDNRTSHFYLALYWAQALASQNENSALKESFKAAAKELSDNEKEIVDCMIKAQGKPADIGGYYLPSKDKLNKVMRPCKTFNSIIDGLM